VERGTEAVVPSGVIIKTFAVGGASSCTDNALGLGSLSDVAAQGAAGQGDIVQVVNAVNAAELTLETVVAIRDKVISAYQDIMRMPI